MTLLEAFRRVGPAVRMSPEVDRERQEAAEVLLGALRKQSGYLWREARGRKDVLEDATQIVLARLVVVGPRGCRAADPADEAGVERWLRKALLRVIIDKARSEAGTSALSPSEPSPQDGPDAVTERRLRLERAWRAGWAVIEERILPTAGAGVGETLAELEAIARGERRFEDVIAAERQEKGGTREQARQRLYTRYHRALKAVAQGALALRAARRITEEQGELVLGILAVLRVSDGW